jgi:hypothetical protein
VNLHCFIFLFGVIIFNILDCTYVELSGKSIVILHWVEIDMDPAPERRAMDADRNPAKKCRSESDKKMPIGTWQKDPT